MLWLLDPSSDEPLYAQLVSQVHIALAKGDLKPGERLPTARDLAESLDLNMHTVLHAYQKLREDGVVELRRGRGAAIVQNTPHTQVAVRRSLDAFAKAARGAGLSPDAAVILFEAGDARMSTGYGTDKPHWRDTAVAASKTLNRLGRKSALLSGIIAIAFLIIATLFAYYWRSDLPTRIPMHWNAVGEPTRFTSFNGMIIEWFIIGVPTIFLCSLLCWKTSTSVMMRRFGVGMNLWMGSFCASMMLAALWFQRGAHSVINFPTSRVIIPNIIAIVAFAIGWFLTPGDPPLPTPSPVMPDAARSVISDNQRAVWLRRITIQMGWLSALVYIAAIAFTLAMGYFLDIFALMQFLAIIMVIAAIACFAYVVKIDNTGLTVRSILGWPRIHVPSNEILNAQITEVSPFADFGGYGWRGGFNGAQVGIITRAGEALLVDRTGNREIVVTTDDAQTAAELLNTFADRSRNVSMNNE